MLPVIVIPAAIAALGTGVVAWAAKAERRAAAEREREEAVRKAQQQRREAAERDVRARHIRAAKQLIAKHQLRITSEFLVELSARGVGSVMLTLNSTAHVARLDQESATVDRLESEVSEVKALIDMIKRMRYP